MVDSHQESTALAARLSPEVERDISRAWRVLDEESGQQVAPQLRFPHLSFQLFSAGCPAPLQDELADLVGEEPAPEIELEGLGLFCYPRSVLYIRVAPSKRLCALQARITELITSAGLEPHPLYLPGIWVPHISLAFDTPENSDWARLLKLEKKGVFHRRCRLVSLVVLNSQRSQPVAREIAF